jgi:hypothetical protein
MINGSTVNAYYNPPNNEIVFPAGIMQGSFFNQSYPPGTHVRLMPSIPPSARSCTSSYKLSLTDIPFSHQLW